MTGRVPTNDRGGGHLRPVRLAAPADGVSGDGLIGRLRPRLTQPGRLRRLPRVDRGAGDACRGPGVDGGAGDDGAETGADAGLGCDDGYDDGPGDDVRAGAGAGDDARARVGAGGGPRRWVAAARQGAAWMLVVPVAAWLLVRVAGVGAGTPVETLVVFTPYATLASVAVLAGVVVLRVWPATVAAAACCVGYALVMAPLFVAGPGPSVSPTGPGLQVMTANVQFGFGDAAELVRLVDEGGVEVLGVQELTPGFHDRLMDEGLGDLLPHGLVDARPGASGTGLYSRHPVERVDHDVAGVHESPTGLLDVPGAPPVQITVVHPTPPVLATGMSDWQRTFDSLPRPGEGADGSGGTVHLLIGDFNATVDQPTMRDLLGDGYVDAAGADGRGWQPTWRSRRFGPGLAIDHVLVDRSTGVDGVSLHDIPGSDHRAVAADLRLPDQGRERGISRR